MPPFSFKRKRAGGGYGLTQTYTPRVAKKARYSQGHSYAQAPQSTGFYRKSGFYGRFQGRNAELKFHDLDIDDATVASGGTIVEDSCNTISQGVGESNRVGRKCTIKSINWRYLVNIPTQAGADGSNSDIVRVVLYLDKQANGAAAGVTDIFESDDFQSFRNLSNTSRFQILMDRTHDINVQALAGDGAANDSGDKFISGTFFKKCNIPIEYSSTTGAITEVRSNNIGVMVFGTQGLAGLGSKMRLRFSDQ